MTESDETSARAEVTMIRALDLQPIDRVADDVKKMVLALDLVPHDPQSISAAVNALALAEMRTRRRETLPVMIVRPDRKPSP